MIINRLDELDPLRHRVRVAADELLECGAGSPADIPRGVEAGRRDELGGEHLERGEGRGRRQGGELGGGVAAGDGPDAKAGCVADVGAAGAAGRAPALKREAGEEGLYDAREDGRGGRAAVEEVREGEHEAVPLERVDVEQVLVVACAEDVSAQALEHGLDHLDGHVRVQFQGDDAQGLAGREPDGRVVVGGRLEEVANDVFHHLGSLGVGRVFAEDEDGCRS